MTILNIETSGKICSVALTRDGALEMKLGALKGLAFSLGIPLIGVDTLKIIAVKAMFRSMDWTGEEVLVPMVDARRMEVFTAPFDFALNPLAEPGPMILDENSFSELLSAGRHLYFLGDGAEKAKKVIDHPNAHWIDGLLPQAKDMLALSEKALREEDFIDIAYSTPNYLKAYQTTTPKNHLV